MSTILNIWTGGKAAYHKPLHVGQRLTHAQAREALTIAFRELFGRDPTLAEVQAVQAVAWGESNYGAGFPPGTNNWGAELATPRQSPPCGPGTFEWTDQSPGEAPEGRCFKINPTPAAGAKSVVRNVYVSTFRNRGPKSLAAARRGDLRGFSTAMYDGGYYESPYADRERAIDWHVKAMQRHLDTITNALDEPLALNGEVGPAGESRSFAPIAAFFGLGALAFVAARSAVR